MIQINSSSEYNPKRLERVIRSFNSGRYQFDVENLKLDIERFEREAETETDELIKENKKRIAKYLRSSILGNLNKFNRLRVKWVVDSDETIKTVPVQLLNMRWCGLDIIDYTFKTDEHTVAVSYRNLWDVMAFIIAHEDFGYTMQDVEAIIKDCGIMAINDGAIMSELVDEYRYNDLNVMMIGKSVYVNKGEDGVVAKDYFGNVVEDVSYKAILQSSIKKMMNCIVDGVLNSLPKGDFNIEFLGLFEDRLYFNTNMDKINIRKLLGQSVIIRMFGRYFEFQPNVKIY